MRRMGFAIRNLTTVGQKLPSDWETKAEGFYNYCKKLIADNKLSLEQILNIDEVPMYFDCLPSQTIISQGGKIYLKNYNRP